MGVNFHLEHHLTIWVRVSQADDSRVKALMYHIIIHGTARDNYESIQWADLDFIEGMYNEVSKTLEIVAYFNEQQYKSTVRALLRGKFGKHVTTYIATPGSDWRQWLQNARKRLHGEPKNERTGFQALAPIGNPPPPPSIDLEYIDGSKRCSEDKQLPTAAAEPVVSAENDCPLEGPTSATSAATSTKRGAEEPAEDDSNCPFEGPSPAPKRPSKAPRFAAGRQPSAGAKLLKRLRELELTNAQLTASNAQLSTTIAQLSTSITKLVDTNAVLASDHAEVVKNNSRVTIANGELMAKHASQSCIIAKLNTEKDALIKVLMQRATHATPQQPAPGVFVFNLQFIQKEMEMGGFVQHLVDACRHVKQKYVESTGIQPVYQQEPSNNQGWAYPLNMMDMVKGWTREFYAGR